MTRAARLLVCVSVWGLALIGGCPEFPNGVPAYTNDGKTIVVPWCGILTRTVWVYDVQGKTAASCPIPDSWRLESARMVEDQLWLACSRDAGEKKDPKTGQVVLDEGTGRARRDIQWLVRPFDPQRQEFVPGAPNLAEGYYFRTPRDCLAAGYEGRKSLLARKCDAEKKNGRTAYDLFTYPELKKQKTVYLNQVCPAGRFWWVQRSDKMVKFRDTEVALLDVLNQDGKHVCSISPEESAKVQEGSSDFPWYARISQDGSALLLVFRGGGSSGKNTTAPALAREYAFGVFDAASGRLLWGGGSDSLSGTPLVKRTEVWTLEYTQSNPPASANASERPRNDRFALVRHRPAEGRDGQAGVREEMLVLAELGDRGQFSPSPDGSHFVMLVHREGPRLLFIPIREGVTDKDVQCVELKSDKR